MDLIISITLSVKGFIIRILSIHVIESTRVINSTIERGIEMTKYIALLRGINVSGQKIITMDTLKSMFESLQLHNVKTYIQSGNVIFESSKEQSNLLRESIESQIKTVYGFDVPVIVRTSHELEEIIHHNPFDVKYLVDEEKIYIAFLSNHPTAEAIERLESYKNEIDDFRVIQREVYILCRKGFGKTLFSNNFIEKKLGVSATTRNWDSVNKIATM